MSDYDDMDADELSHEVVQRRGDHVPDNDMREGGEWMHPDRYMNAGCISDDPQLYASELWACESLLEDLDALAKDEDGVELKPFPNCFYSHRSLLRVEKNSRIFRSFGDTRPAAIARLWLKCDDAGLFDDGDEGDDEPEYTDEELAEYCEKAWKSRETGSETNKALQAARDRLHEISDLEDERRQALDELDWNGDGLVAAARHIAQDRKSWMELALKYEDKLVSIKKTLPQDIQATAQVADLAEYVEEATEKLDLVRKIFSDPEDVVETADRLKSKYNFICQALGSPEDPYDEARRVKQRSEELTSVEQVLDNPDDVVQAVRDLAEDSETRYVAVCQHCEAPHPQSRASNQDQVSLPDTCWNCEAGHGVRKDPVWSVEKLDEDKDQLSEIRKHVPDDNLEAQKTLADAVGELRYDFDMLMADLGNPDDPWERVSELKSAKDDLDEIRDFVDGKHDEELSTVDAHRGFDLDQMKSRGRLEAFEEVLKKLDEIQDQEDG